MQRSLGEKFIHLTNLSISLVNELSICLTFAVINNLQDMENYIWTPQRWNMDMWETDDLESSSVNASIHIRRYK